MKQSSSLLIDPIMQDRERHKKRFYKPKTEHDNVKGAEVYSFKSQKTPGSEDLPPDFEKSFILLTDKYKIH